MHQSPEGLDYGSHKAHCADAKESYLEKGKYTTGAISHQEHDRAGLERMLGRGSHDPMYTDSHKNK
jgi:hypothetical protein